MYMCGWYVWCVGVCVVCVCDMCVCVLCAVVWVILYLLTQNLHHGTWIFFNFLKILKVILMYLSSWERLP